MVQHCYFKALKGIHLLWWTLLVVPQRWRHPWHWRTNIHGITPLWRLHLPSPLFLNKAICGFFGWTSCNCCIKYHYSLALAWDLSWFNPSHGSSRPINNYSKDTGCGEVEIPLHAHVYLPQSPIGTHTLTLSNSLMPYLQIWALRSKNDFAVETSKSSFIVKVGTSTIDF